MREEQARTGDQGTGADGAQPADPALRRICERFPLLRQLATLRFAIDENFRDMCMDYDTCADTLARLESSQPRDEGMRDEYTALLLRFERELLRHLAERPTHAES